MSASTDERTFIPWRRFNGAQIPEQLLESKLISNAAKLCWGQLARYAGEDGECFPGQKRLAKDISKSERSIRYYIRDLENAKLIRVKQRGLNETNSYEFLWHEVFEKPLILQDRQLSAGQDRQDLAGQERQEPAGPLKEEENQIKRTIQSIHPLPLTEPEHEVQVSPPAQAQIDRTDNYSHTGQDQEQEVQVSPPTQVQIYKQKNHGWPGQDMRMLEDVVGMYEYKDGTKVEPTEEIITSLLAKGQHYMQSPLRIADILYKKHHYVSRRPSVAPEKPTWFAAVIEAHFFAELEARKPKPKPPQKQQPMRQLTHAAAAAAAGIDLEAIAKTKGMPTRR